MSPTRSEASTFLNGLSRRSCCMSYCTFRYSGLKDSPLFMRVHAITSILAASFTLILVLIPLSRSRPWSILAKQAMKERCREEAMR